MSAKRILFCAALGLCFSTAAEINAQTKIGVVDMSRVFKEHPKTKEGEAKINQAKDAAKKELEERAEEYKKALDEINKINQQLEAPSLSAEAKMTKGRERDEKIARIKTMEREINEFRQTREQQLREQVLRMRDGILKEITDIVMERVKAKNLDLVFDKSGASGNGFSPLLFFRESDDFTAEVIAALNQAK